MSFMNFEIVNSELLVDYFKSLKDKPNVPAQTIVFIDENFKRTQQLFLDKLYTLCERFMPSNPDFAFTEMAQLLLKYISYIQQAEIIKTLYTVNKIAMMGDAE